LRTTGEREKWKVSDRFMMMKRFSSPVGLMLPFLGINKLFLVAAESGVMQSHMIFSQGCRSYSNFFNLGLKNNNRKGAMAMSFHYLITTSGTNILCMESSCYKEVTMVHNDLTDQ
jgi:hypothetical protein